MSDKINGREFHPMVLELGRGQNFAALTTLLLATSNATRG
ncbi:MAG: hypothetical protein K0Q96_607 [Rubrobacteraceae bacterium]|nr:hypothetical protein [Rubrobacteraceae bacterium]